MFGHYVYLYVHSATVSLEHTLIHVVINRYTILRRPSHDFRAPVNMPGNYPC